MVSLSIPPVTSQNLAVLSQLALASVRPSGENASPVTKSVCPLVSGPALIRALLSHLPLSSKVGCARPDLRWQASVHPDSTPHKRPEPHVLVGSGEVRRFLHPRGERAHRSHRWRAFVHRVKMPSHDYINRGACPEQCAIGCVPHFDDTIQLPVTIRCSSGLNASAETTLSCAFHARCKR